MIHTWCSECTVLLLHFQGGGEISSIICMHRRCTNASLPPARFLMCVPIQFSTYSLLFHREYLCLPHARMYSAERIPTLQISKYTYPALQHLMVVVHFILRGVSFHPEVWKSLSSAASSRFNLFCTNWGIPAVCGASQGTSIHVCASL